MFSQTVEGIILKRSNFGEGDKLITLFTRTKGKTTVLAKGVRKLSSKRAGSLELFNLVKASIITGKGELDILTEVQLINPFLAWRNQLGRVTLAYQICETIDKLTPDHQPHPYIFNLLVTSLSQISQLNSNWQQVIDTWLLQIIRELGFWPHDKSFTGDIQKFIETISERPINSPKLLKKLKRC